MLLACSLLVSQERFSDLSISPDPLPAGQVISARGIKFFHVLSLGNFICKKSFVFLNSGLSQGSPLSHCLPCSPLSP
nr:MAG TPA: hypothetical protein [Caudoviricetes sp.]